MHMAKTCMLQVFTTHLHSTTPPSTPRPQQLPPPPPPPPTFPPLKRIATCASCFEKFAAEAKTYVYKSERSTLKLSDPAKGKHPQHSSPSTDGGRCAARGWSPPRWDGKRWPPTAGPGTTRDAGRTRCCSGPAPIYVSLSDRFWPWQLSARWCRNWLTGDVTPAKRVSNEVIVHRNVLSQFSDLR